jgi:hypothetical protein
MPIADEPLVLDLGEQAPKVWLEAMPAIVRETGSALGTSSHGQRVKQVPTAVISDVIKAVSKQLREDLKGTELEKVSLGFALSVDTTGRVLIGASGTFRVQLEWRKPDADT